MEFTERQIKNFWSKVDVRDADQCWPWLASRRKARPGQLGYGQVHINGRTLTAHRIAYMMATGRDPGDCKIMHSCDNPLCCNPHHLSEGTHQDNMDDMTAKGRQGKKLTAEIALEIRKAEGTGTQREIADRYGVTHRTVGQIWNCQTWSTI